MWNLKKGYKLTYLQNRNRQNKFRAPKGDGGWVWGRMCACVGVGVCVPKGDGVGGCVCSQRGRGVGAGVCVPKGDGVYVWVGVWFGISMCTLQYME